MELKIQNTPEELASFPIEQDIVLTSDEDLEDSNLEANITLIRELKSNSGFNNSDLFNYNIGYVKEEFSTIDLKVVEVEQEDESFKIVCNPVKPLAPGSKYILFIDKNLSKEYVDLSKVVSKGPSELKLLSISEETEKELLQTYRYEIVSKPVITETANIVKIKLTVNDDPIKTYTINAKSDKNTISYNGVSVQVLDTAYGLGEEFHLKINRERVKLDRNLVVHIKTASSSLIKPIENAEPSHSLTYQDVINFYNGSVPQGPSDLGIDFNSEKWQEQELRVEYVDDYQFILHLNKLSACNIDFEHISILEFPAYNRSDLKLLNLYSPDEKFIVTPEILDDKTILFTMERQT